MSDSPSPDISAGELPDKPGTENSIEQQRYQKFLDRATQSMAQLTDALEKSDRGALAELAGGLAVMSQDLPTRTISQSAAQLHDRAHEAEHQAISAMIWQIQSELAVMQNQLPDVPRGS